MIDAVKPVFTVFANAFSQKHLLVSVPIIAPLGAGFPDMVGHDIPGNRTPDSPGVVNSIIPTASGGDENVLASETKSIAVAFGTGNVHANTDA